PPLHPPRGALGRRGDPTGTRGGLGHRARSYSDGPAGAPSPPPCHKHAAVNANVLAAHAVLALDRSRLEPDLADGVAELFGAETYIVPGRVYGGLPPRGPPLIPPGGVIPGGCRPQPGGGSQQGRPAVELRLP